MICRTYLHRAVVVETPPPFFHTAISSVLIIAFATGFLRPEIH